jgi:hypothetical protein
LSRKSTDSVTVDIELPQGLKRELEQAKIMFLKGEAIGNIATIRVIEELQNDLKNEIIESKMTILSYKKKLEESRREGNQCST